MTSPTWPQAFLLMAMRAFLFADEWLWIWLSLKLWREVDMPTGLALGILLPAGVVAIYLIGYKMQWRMERRFGVAE